MAKSADNSLKNIGVSFHQFVLINGSYAELISNKIGSPADTGSIANAASLILSLSGSRYLYLSLDPGFECRQVPYLCFIATITSATPMPGDNDENPSRRGPLIALAVVVVLFVVGWLLANALYSNGKLEDCLLSGRTNCAPVDTQSR
jgi:hypothetical protein